MENGLVVYESQEIGKIMKRITSVSYNLVAKFVAMLFFYLQDILLARLLGIEGYAEWAYFFSIMTIVFWVSNLGINNAMQAIVARDADNQKNIFNHIVSGIILRIFVSGIFSMLIILGAKPACTIGNTEDKYEHLFVLLLLGAAYIFLYIIVEFWKCVAIGLKRTDKLLIITVFEHAGHFVWSLICYYVLKNVYGIIIGYIISYAITMFVSEKTYGIGKKRDLLEKEKIKQNMQMVAKSSCSYIIACLTAFVLMEMDTVMLGSMQSNKTELALYVTAKKITSKAPNLNEAILTALMVDFAVINFDNIHDKKKDFKRILAINIMCTIGVSIVLIVLGRIAIGILYGEEFRLSYKYLMILLPSYIITAINQMFVYFLYYQDQAGYVSASYFVSLIINLILNTLLIPIYGAVGAGVGTVISLIPFILLLAFRVKKIFRKYI